MVKKIIFIMLTVWVGFLLFMPKAEFYYTLEKKLSLKDIYLNEDQIDEGLFTLNVKNITVYAKGIEIAHIKEVSFFTFLFYNSLKAKDIKLDEMLSANAPITIDSLKAIYILARPFTVTLEGNGSLGEIDGKINVLHKNIHMDLMKIKNINTLKPFLKKDKRGWYYEKSF
jgi:hypothetical protein